MGNGPCIPLLIPRSKRPTIPIASSHQLAVLTEELDWDELLELVEEIRSAKVKNDAGSPPHLRALVGALLLKATRDLTFREAEDLVRYYAPARYLYGLTETEWSPDHNTLHDFEVLLGEEGVRLVNEYVVELALKERLTFSSLAVGDTTAQEAAIPYPNEMKLMAAFLSSVAGAAARAGKKLKRFVNGASERFQQARETLREFRLFGKTSEARRRGVAQMMKHVQVVQAKLRRTLEGYTPVLRGYGKVAFARLQKLQQVMKQLLPQIQYWHRTGWVAAKKIISLFRPKLYSVPRGKWGSQSNLV